MRGQLFQHHVLKTIFPSSHWFFTFVRNLLGILMKVYFCVLCFGPLIYAAALHWTGHVEITHTQGQRNPSKTFGTGAAVRRYPHRRAKEKPPDRMGEFAFRIKSHSCQRGLEGSNKPCVHQDPGTPQRLRQNCV